MRPADRLHRFQESVIREMTRLAIERQAVNLSQGFPDFDTPEEVKDAAIRAIQEAHNQYTPTWGYAPLREKIAEQYIGQLGWSVDPMIHVTVTCGVTEAINATFLAFLNPGDQVIIIEPAHENFIPSAIFAGAEPVAVPLEEPDYRLDPDRLKDSITARSKVLLLNTPHNPTGRIFDAEELATVRDVVVKHDLVLVTDEIYDRILFDGRQHVSPGSLEPLKDRTVTISGFSKTFAITGWRLGYIVAPTHLSEVVRPVHDFLTVCAPAPLQVAAVTALSLPQDYYHNLVVDYSQRRELMMGILDSVGFVAPEPQGAYYVLADYSQSSISQAEWDSTRFARWMIEEIGVAVVPGTVFYSLPGYGEHSVRFAFPKRIETLQAASERMEALRSKS